MTASPPVITDASVTLTFGAAGQYYGYCTLADVRYEFPAIGNYPSLAVGATGNTNIAQEITYAALDLQSVLNHYYVMPYAGSDWMILNTLRLMNAKQALARLLDRYQQGEQEAASGVALQVKAEVAAFITDLREGVVRWDAPFGDATPQAMLPVYDQARGLTISGSSPSSADPNAQAPIFTIGRTRFRTDQM